MRRLGILAVVFTVLATPGVILAQSADFGDFTGGAIPTTRAAGGPYHVDVTHEWIGTNSGTTTVETDAKAVDEDDGAITISSAFVDGAFGNLGRVTVPVTTDTDTTIRYLNVAADLNNDG